MFDLLGKKKKEPTATPTSQPTQPVVMKTGEEIQFRDDKTGEFVYQRALSADHQKTLMAAMQKNANLAQQFMGMAFQMVDLFDAVQKSRQSIKESEKEINDTINKVRDEMKVDRRWGLNLQKGVLERRDAPNA